MKARRGGGLPGKVEQNMTPMIDVVFQLLAFFVMTFKLATVEGDFNIKMPLSAPSAGVSDNPVPPLKLVMNANASGQLTSMSLGENPITFDQLRARIEGIANAGTGPGSLISQTEVELDCDPRLNYAYVIQAITSVSGRLNPKTGQVTRYVEKIKFSSPRLTAGITALYDPFQLGFDRLLTRQKLDAHDQRRQRLAPQSIDANLD